MSDSAAQAGSGEAALDEAVGRWSSDPSLAPLFAAPGGALLVIDAAATRVLHATRAAEALRAAITDAEGRVLGTLRLPEQLRRAAPSAIGARSARIRFDPRGLARPTACLVARAGTGGDDDGNAVLLLAPTEPLPALRPAARRKPADAAPGPAPVPEPEQQTEPEAAPRPSGRLVWRSDADGILTRVSGIEPQIAERLAGRSWQALGESGEAVGEALLAALSERYTFRALPLTLRVRGVRDEIDLDLSGMPAARPSQPFAGFSGFGTERDRRPRGEDPAEERMEDGAGTPREAAHAAPPAAPPEPEPEQAAVDPVPPPPEHDVPVASEAAEPAPAAVPEDAPAAVPEDAPAVPSEPVCRGADLSIHEHAAFREIARALGARFAGDEEGPPEGGPLVRGGPRGAVMAFPTTAANQGTAIEAAIVAALDRLPAGVLVHRDGAVLYANRRFLDLAGCADARALDPAGGLAPLFAARGAEERGASTDEVVSIKTGTSELRGLLVERSRVDWEGAPSELLLVRAAGAADPARERIARGLLQSREMAREREAQTLLDHIEEGVAAIDESGRLLALNRSASAILSGEARELVGGLLADLFAPESAPAVTASLREAREGEASAPREVVPRTRPDPVRLRIARFAAQGAPRFCATLRELPPAPPGPATAPPPAQPAATEPRAKAQENRTDASRVDFLARVGREIRTPINGILGHADALLAEQLGPLGSERTRDSLRDIRASGEHVLGIVDDLLHLARIEAGRADLAFTDLALNELVSNCITLMQPQAARDRIVVRTSLSPDLKPLVADERSMRQAALNVIANAIRFTEAGGQVIVSTTIAERGEIAFRVKDTGIGMSPEEIENALEPFRRETAAPRGGGTGLGLTLTKALVEANRGRFRITSRKNEGTLVEMLFPPPEARSA